MTSARTPPDSPVSADPPHSDGKFDVTAYVTRPSRKSVAIEPEKLKAGLDKTPLVSCLMVSRGDVRVLQYSLLCYLRQDYPNRELILVTSHPSDELESFLARFPEARITLVKAPAGLSIGELRNISLKHAKGTLVSTWDDDDLHAPERLSTSIRILQAGKAGAFVLPRYLLWWPARKLISLSCPRPAENSMVALRNIVPPYQPLMHGEDLLSMLTIRRYHPIATADLPWLYCYTVTGRNTWDESHFRKIVDTSATVFEGSEYDKGIERLARRVPIREYAAMLEKLIPEREPAGADV
jgi:glycosyltransferase involved in cell wall biosynthesis